MSPVPWGEDWEVLLVNRSGRTRNVARSVSPLGSDDVCCGRDDCMPDVCLQQLRADRKAICVRPPLRHRTGNSNWKGRKRPVCCQVGSMLVFVEFRHSVILSERQVTLKKCKLSTKTILEFVDSFALMDGWVGGAHTKCNYSSTSVMKLTRWRRLSVWHKRPAVCQRGQIYEHGL